MIRTRFRPWWHIKRIVKNDYGVKMLHAWDKLRKDERGFASWFHGIDCHLSCCPDGGGGGPPPAVDRDCTANAEEDCDSCAIPCSLGLKLQNITFCTCVEDGPSGNYFAPYDWNWGGTTPPEELRFDHDAANDDNDYLDASEWCAVWRTPGIGGMPGATQFRVFLDRYSDSSCISIVDFTTNNNHLQIYLLNDLSLDINMRTLFAANETLATCADLAVPITMQNESTTCPAGPVGWVRNPTEFPTWGRNGTMTVTPYKDFFWA